MNELETRTGESREMGLVGWGGSALRRALWWRGVRDSVGRMLRIQQRSAARQMRRRAIKRAIQQALGAAGPL